MKRKKMYDLIEKLQTTSSPNRELDIEIHEAITPPYLLCKDSAGYFINIHGTALNPVWIPTHKSSFPRYTFSVDAALCVIPENWFLSKLQKVYTRITKVGDKHEFLYWQAGVQYIHGGRLTLAKHKVNPALVICIAGLRARNRWRE